VPDWDNRESRERDEDAAWRDLIARFDAPVTADESAPWPDREDVPSRPAADEAHEASGAAGEERPGEDGESIGANGATGASEASGVNEAAGVSGASGISEVDEPGRVGQRRDSSGTRGPREDGEDRDGGQTARQGQGDGGRTAPPGQGDGGRTAPPGLGGEGRDAASADGVWGIRGGEGSVDADRIWRALEAEGLLGQTEPDVIQATRRRGRPPAGGMPVRGASEDDDEHFVPPVPPPLPKLDPVTKGAWAALFGGPGYLLVATALHWSVPGLAVFCAVAAFVTGFALLVLRMNEPGPGGPDDGDDGAVV
jgi:hypothetical protein